MAISHAQKLKQLKAKLADLEQVKLKVGLAKYGQSYQDSAGSWQENAAWELADEEISVFRAMIFEIKAEIKNIEHQPTNGLASPPAKSK